MRNHLLLVTIEIKMCVDDFSIKVTRKKSKMCACVPLLLLSSLSPGLLLALQPCPPECTCHERAFLVDCGGRGLPEVPAAPHGTALLELSYNNVTELRRGAFTHLWTLRVLLLGHNWLTSIQEQAFGRLSFLEKLDLSWNRLTRLPDDFSTCLAAVRELHLQHNSIQQLSPNSLGGLDRVEKLDLSHNQLVSLGVRSLWGLSNLRHLDLQHNRLQLLQQGALDRLPALEVLSLCNNSLVEIDPEVLATLYSLSVLDLKHNKLQHVKFKTFISLRTTATHIQLAGNPWSCDCELHRGFSKVLRVRHLLVEDYEEARCEEPPDLAGEALAAVDSQLCVAETATVMVITGTVLVTVAAALVMAERTRKRNRGNRESQNTSSPA